MKYPLYVAFLLASGFSFAQDIYQFDLSNIASVPNCANEGNMGDDSCKTCGTKGNAKQTSGGLSCGYSVINNITFGYATFSKDYIAPQSPSACQSCGDTSAISGRSRLPEFQILRYRNPSAYPANCSSFGEDSGLMEYDVNLTFDANQPFVMLYQNGYLTNKYRLDFDVSRGAWADRYPLGESWFGLYLFDSTGAPITSSANRNQAHSGSLVNQDGSSKHFEIIWHTNGSAHGRVTALMDRYGNAIDIAHVTAQPATPLIKVSDFLPYYKIFTITDAHNRQASFQYHAPYQGRQLVSIITLPNGQQIKYFYASLPDLGNRVLNRIEHPDGAVSTWASSILTSALLTKCDIYEAKDDPTKRRKTTYLSKNTGYDTSGNVVTSYRRRIRASSNGEGEITYANRVGETSGIRYVYSGGNSNMRFAATGYLSSYGISSAGYVTDTASIPNFYSANSATWATETDLPLRSTHSSKYPASLKDACGRSETFTRQSLSALPIDIDFADNTSELYSYNTFSQPLITTDRLGRTTVRTYSPQGSLLSETRASGTADATTHTWLYNTRGQIIEDREPLYDPNKPELHNTQFEYDANGFMVKKIDSADLEGGTRPETLYAYDFAGRLASITNPRGAVTTFVYDNESRLIETTYADGSTDLVEYGTAFKSNLIVKTTDRNGIITDYLYDNADRLVSRIVRDPSVTTPLMSESRTYLKGTNLVKTTTRDGDTQTTLYDHRNRSIATQSKPNTATTLTTSKELDVLSRTRSTTDAYGRKTYFLYDQNDNITRTVTETVAGALAAPALQNTAQQTEATHTYSFTDKDNNTLTTQGTHLVTYTSARDLFLKNLTRDLNPNAAYLITDAIHDAEGQTLVSTDARGIKTWMQYDKLGRNTLTIQALGTPDEVRMETIYDDNSNVIESRSPRHFTEGNGAGLKQFTYTGRNLRATQTTADGTAIEATESYTYLPDGKPSTHTDARGNVSTQKWKACCGRLQAVIDRDEQSTQISNTDHEGNVVHTATVSVPPVSNWSDPLEPDTVAETTTRVDGLGRPTHTTQWLVTLGAVDAFSRPSLGNGNGVPIAGLNGVPAADGLTTTYLYDENLTDGIGIDQAYSAQLATLATRGVAFGVGATGSAIQITNPAGESQVLIKDGLGRNVMVIDAEGNFQTTVYDEVLPTITPPHLTSIPLPGDLLVTTSTDALGHQTSTYSDGAGRTLLLEDAAGNLSGFAYDANSNRTITRDANGLGENCTYDSLNRDTSCADLQEQAQNVSRSKTYNAHGAVLTSTDAEGNVSTFVYDARDRQTSSTDPNNLTTSYAFDLNSNLLSLTDPKGNTRTWTYDLRNLQMSKTIPGDPTDTCQYQHDALGRLTIKTQQDNSTITMTYDLAGRMTQRDYSDSTSDTFTYDAASRLLSATKGRHAITTTRTYAPDGAQLTETQTLDGRTYTLARSYDADNQVLSQTFADNKVMTWTYDSRHLVTAAHYDGTLVLNQTHDPAGRLTQQAFGNNLTRNITFGRQDNQRTADKVHDGTPVIDELSFIYTYAVDKNVLTEAQADGNLEKLSFTAGYDAGNRVISYNRQDSYQTARETQSWNYDDAGNWNSTSIDGNVQNRTHNASDEITAIAGDNLTHDVRGNLLTDNRGNAYTWDLDKRIVKADGSYTDITYRYDALGRRIVRTQGTNKEVLLWWGNTEQSEHEHKAGQDTIQNDLQANPSETALNTIFARALEGSKFEIQYFHKNYLDHVMAVTNDTGNIIEQYRYTAFGEPEIYSPTGNKIAATAINNDILWNVRRYEPVTGLYMYLYRDYDAPSGRWGSRDPIEEMGGVNLYAFINNFIVNKWDYLGLFRNNGDDQILDLPELPPIELPPPPVVPDGPDRHNNWRLPDSSRPEELILPDDVGDQGENSTLCWICEYKGTSKWKLDKDAARKYFERLMGDAFDDDKKLEEEFIQRRLATIEKDISKRTLISLGDVSSTRTSACWKAKRVVLNSMWLDYQRTQGLNWGIFDEFELPKNCNCWTFPHEFNNGGQGDNAEEYGNDPV
ncbi:MAG: RHS repeat-associated core domain-containing protein [Akkermansiaceae bacterium]|jgi:RHS repeat-associated protein